VFQSDTDELLLEAKQRRFRVVTRLTEAAVFEDGAGLVLGKARIVGADGPAMIAVSSMDGKPLDESQRMLAILATDAINTGMTFADPARTRLVSQGTLPPRIRAGKVTVELESSHAARIRAYGLDLTGKRGPELTLERGAKSVRVTLDNKLGAQGPTTFFEIALEG